MSESAAFDLAAHVAARGWPFVVLRRRRDLDEFEDAVSAFSRDGDRPAFMRRLFAIGVAPGSIRRLASGERMCAIVAG